MSYVVDGNRISELEKTEGICENSKFLLTRIYEEAEKQAETYGLNYSTLSSRILEDVQKMLHLSSMAYENKYSYSKITHQHDYSNFDMKVFYGPDSDRKDEPFEVVQLATIDISNDNERKSLRICVPKIEYEKPKEYRIGEIKFVYVSEAEVHGKLEELGYTEVNGWAIPDGTKVYLKENYPDAYEIYKTEDDDTGTFQLPVISGFFRLNPGIEKDQPLKRFPHHNSQVRHVHDINQDAKLGHVELSARFEMETYLYAVSDGAQKTCAHCGVIKRHPYDPNDGVDNVQTIDLDVEGNPITVTKIKVDECYSEDEESYPTHDTLIAVVYIGEKEILQDE